MSGAPSRRSNEERQPMVQAETSNQHDFILLKYIKISGSLFLILVSCAAVAYGLTMVVWNLFEDRSADSSHSTTSSSFSEASASSSANAFFLSNGDSGNLKQFGWYILVFVLGGVIASILGTIVWYFLKENNRGTVFRQNTPQPILPISTEQTQFDRNLVDCISSIIETYQIDGVDIFWKYPSETSSREFYVQLLLEIRQRLTEIQTTGPSYLLSVVMPSFDWATYKDTIDLNGILEHVDFMNVRTINYYGFWFTEWGFYTGPPAPLYSGIGQYENSNVDWTMKYCSANTGMPSMLNLGVPFFGAYWNSVEGSIEEKEEMWFTAKTKTEGEHDYDGDYLGWRDIKNKGWDISTATWHQESRCPFIWVPQERKFLGFENPQSIAEKVKYAVDNNIGGITIWSVEMDDNLDTLLGSIQKQVIDRAKKDGVCTKKKETRIAVQLVFRLDLFPCTCYH